MKHKVIAAVLLLSVPVLLAQSPKIKRDTVAPLKSILEKEPKSVRLLDTLIQVQEEIKFETSQTVSKLQELKRQQIELSNIK